MIHKLKTRALSFTTLSISLLFYCLVFASSISCDDDTESPIPEPPFPLIFDPVGISSNHRIHIISETVSDSHGYETSEEYVDLKVGKSTVIVSNKEGRTVTHLEASTGLTYIYSPYTCKVTKTKDEDIVNSRTVWSSVVEVEMDDGKKYRMQMYGLAALWFNAESLPKTYTKSNFIYSASKDIYRPTHKWTITDTVNKQLVHLYFISDGESDIYSLEMIQLESIETKKIVHTTNILSIEYSIPEQVYDELMEVPIGYGCREEASNHTDLINSNISYQFKNALGTTQHRIEIEATATKFEETANSGTKRLSDTISVELVRSKEGRRDFQLMRIRDTNQDKKSVLDYKYKVHYAMDLRKASCVMSNLDANMKSDDERVSLKFSNGLTLNMDHTKMVELFSSYDFYFVKDLGQTSARGRRTVYYERTSTTLFEGRTSRIIRTYSVLEDQGNLESVSIWVLDSRLQHIVESYHLNVIDVSAEEDLTELAKLFDLSEECYLNNDKMKFGRDYTWFELFYPVDSRTNEVLSGHSSTIKTEVFEHFEYNSGITFLQMPRVELMFEETGFIVRALLLDVPALHLIYDFQPDQTITMRSGDASELAVDVEHCAELCRYNRCKTMTFCQSTSSCSLSTFMPGAMDKNDLAKKAGCNTYTLPKESGFSLEDITTMRLHSILGKFRHNDYTALALPKIPEELYLPMSESGLDEVTYQQICKEYRDKVNKMLVEEGHKLPMLTLYILLNNHPLYLLPSRFELEQDPLNDFELGDESYSQSDDKSLALAFHRGLNMYRYKINTFNDDQKRNARLFNGLTYDQCALACIDSKCSSFSYCSFRQECTITDIYDIGASMSKSIVESDSDCFIAQRDYVTKFNKFENVYRPHEFMEISDGLNPSECAYKCMTESGFNCLAFDFCAPTESMPNERKDGRLGSTATCYFFKERQLFSPVIEKIMKKDEKKAPTETGCDHYTRSYLADFNRVEFRQVDETELAKLKTSSVSGPTVDECANFCVNKVVDCTAFQLCLDPDQPWITTCTTIESKPQVSNSSDTRVTLNPKNDNAVLDAGRFFKPSVNCNVFIMRKDSMEASARESAFSINDGTDGGRDGQRGGGSLTFGGGILLYLGMTIVFASLSAGLCVAKYHNSYIAARIERVQIFLGLL